MVVEVPVVFLALVVVAVVVAGVLAMVEAVPVVRPLEVVVVVAVAMLLVPAVVAIPVSAVTATTPRAVLNNVVRCLQQVALCANYPPVRHRERTRPFVPAPRKLRREIGSECRHRQRLPWVTREFVAAVV